MAQLCSLRHLSILNHSDLQTQHSSLLHMLSTSAASLSSLFSLPCICTCTHEQGALILVSWRSAPT